MTTPSKEQLAFAEKHNLTVKMSPESTCVGCSLDGTRRCESAPCSSPAVVFVKAPIRRRPAATKSTPAAQTKAVAGRKDDGGKLDVTLFFDDLPHAIEAVTEVLQWAITKKLPEPYDRGSWQGVEPFQQRYRAAMLRHVLNRAKALKGGTVPTGEPTDHETGLMELAHIATDAMFQLEMAVRKVKGLPTPEGA